MNCLMPRYKYSKKTNKSIIYILLYGENSAGLHEEEEKDFFETDDFIFEEEEEECFEHELFLSLHTCQEIIRYFILYLISNSFLFDDLEDDLIKDINTLLTTDLYITFKAIQKLFFYDVDFIPFNEDIKNALIESMKSEDLADDSSILIILYTKKFGTIYENQEFYDLFDFSLLIDDNRRSVIMNFLSKIIFLFDVPIPFILIEKLINSYDSMIYTDKVLIVDFLFALLLSKNATNKTNAYFIFRNYAFEVKTIMDECIDTECKITIINATFN